MQRLLKAGIEFPVMKRNCLLRKMIKLEKLFFSIM